MPNITKPLYKGPPLGNEVLSFIEGCPYLKGFFFLLLRRVATIGKLAAHQRWPIMRGFIVIVISSLYLVYASIEY